MNDQEYREITAPFVKEYEEREAQIRADCEKAHLRAEARYYAARERIDDEYRRLIHHAVEECRIKATKAVEEAADRLGPLQ